MIGQGAVERVASSRCVACNHVIVDAYLCDECGLSSGTVRSRYAEHRSTTATEQSRAEQRSIGDGMEFDHWMAVIGIQYREDGETEMARSEGEHKNFMRFRRNGVSPRFTRAELNQWESKLVEMGRSACWGSPDRQARFRRDVLRRRYTRFCEVWSIIALRMFTAQLTVEKPKKRKKVHFEWPVTRHE